uniref:uncharacterized protein LOC122585513 isoform X1 n=1 Tax=Erigeron canadensis TaxID=72917 RepID=UPI001CB9663A|nr:uncharacterized protein LOC122585513 isoform X1 [Erigeron canadensis]
MKFILYVTGSFLRTSLLTWFVGRLETRFFGVPGDHLGQHGYIFVSLMNLRSIIKSRMVFCWCGKQAILRTSWTDRNPGRRFYACPKEGSKCRFIGWHDPEMCQRATKIIPGLLRSKNRVERQLKQRYEQVKRLKIMLLLASIVILFLVSLLLV